RLNIRHLPDNELSTLSAPAVITLLLQKGNTLFRKTTLPMTVSQRRCRRKMQGLGAGDEEALSPLAEVLSLILTYVSTTYCIVFRRRF
ncbi:hypothetical protein, partial [Pseudomonas aeruginosa]|uniref:hypothetical protein n=1 Tax=Pseudomonas aeruginosa TaxID=287 RepID=UPI001C1257C3